MAGLKDDSSMNPRDRRVLAALLDRPHYREELDRIAGASNSPQLIWKLRHHHGIHVRCRLIDGRDRDGRTCRRGLYMLTGSARSVAQEWLRKAG